LLREKIPYQIGIDQGGNYYDSAVFLEAGSFKSKIDLGSDRLWLLTESALAKAT
jgi:hypothetical protein